MQTGTIAIPSWIVTAWLLLISINGWTLELEVVLSNVAVTPPSRIGFVEQRHNRLLKEPLVLTGYLEYVQTGQLRKVIETPFAEDFFITEDFIEINRDGKTRRLSLHKSKPMKAMFGGIEAILAGQVEELAALFRYELSGTIEAWSLRMEPLSDSIARHLTVMLVEGDGDSANSIRLELKDGEWSLMEFMETVPKQ